MFQHRLNDSQPFVGQIGSISNGSAAKNIQSDCGLGSVDRYAAGPGERKSLEQMPSANGSHLLTYSRFNPVCQCRGALRAASKITARP